MHMRRLANSRVRGWSERECDRERVSASGLAVGAHACAHTYAARCTCADWPTVTREGGQNACAIVRESALQDLRWVRMLARIPTQRDAH
eukprot:2317184-Pleurochrysis_carterae.AAC.1